MLRSSRHGFGPLLCLGIATVVVAALPVSARAGNRVAGAVIDFYQTYISDLRYGNCRFDPSCSHYGAEAIERYGLFRAAALTGDRLVRCNARAYLHYPRGANGRLFDPVDAPPATTGRPEVPMWLLPRPFDPPFPMQAVQAHSLSLEPVPVARVSRLKEYAAFGDALAAAGDCDRAETEYRRVAFLARTEATDGWALTKSGNGYYRWKRWNESAARFLEATEVYPDGDGRARFMAAAARFNDGHYEQSLILLDGCRGPTSGGRPVPERPPVGGERIDVLSGLCAMGLGNWTDGASHFNRAAAGFPDSPNRNQSLFLKWKAEMGADAVSNKSPAVAGLLSVIPGMGQMYTGRYFDGFRHLLVDGLLITGTYQLFRNEEYAFGYLMAGFTLPFYAGNIVGARESARVHNATQRATYLSQAIVEASGQ